MTFYLYSGAGNTFVVLDGREIISEMEADAPEQEQCKCYDDSECGCHGGEDHECGCGGHHEERGHHCCHEHAAEEEHHCCHGGGGGGCCHRGGASPWEQYVQDVCAHFSTDGLMMLLPSETHDFEMAFFNPDGTGGMMCGNGGRCIVAFADYLGIKPKDGKTYHFVAGDGPHDGEILAVVSDGGIEFPQTPCGLSAFPYLPSSNTRPGRSPDGDLLPTPTHHQPAIDGVIKTVRIRMVDVSMFCPVLDGWFVDTGTRHFVKFVPEVEGLNMDEEGKRYRWDPVFAPVGANANFVKVEPDRLVVRTFEKGVEGETLACGTGITASAIAAYMNGVKPHEETDGRLVYHIRAREDDLRVEFKPVFTGDDVATLAGFSDVYLIGPAKMFGKA